MQSQLSSSHSSSHSAQQVSGSSYVYGGVISPHKVVEPDVHFEESERLGRYGGKHPSVSLNNSSTAVVVHNSMMGNSLWYWVGRLDEVTEQIFWASGRHFEYGLHPCVTLKDSGMVIEVHRSQWQHELKCTIGRVNGDFIKWSKCRTYANGVEASVAVNNSDTVVAVHVNDTHIQCMVGEASSKSIQWGSSNTIGIGARPRVAINDSDTVVMVYQSRSKNSLQCQIGVVNKMSIHWGRSIEYAHGLSGSVSLTSSHRMLILRQGRWLDELVYGVAKVNQQEKNIEEESDAERCRNHMLARHKVQRCNEEKSTFFWHPSVSINDQGKILVIYTSSSEHGRQMWYQLGSLTESEDSDPPSYYGSDDEQYLSTPSDDC